MGDDGRMRILSRRDVEALLDLDQLVEAVASAMVDLSEGRASLPPRVAATVEEHRAILAAMPGYLPSARALTSKLVSVFPNNPSLGLHSHQAVILAFDPDTGTPLALMDGTYITAVRTAAGSALATRLLALPEASVLAIIGTGVQARAHARAIPRVRVLSEMRVAGRDEPKAEAAADELGNELSIPVKAVSSYREAMDGADIVCGTTHSPEPVIRREWLVPGVHVNSVGVNAEGPEVDSATVADAVVVVESRRSALAPFPAGATDLTWPIRDGLITEDHIHAEIGELLTGAKPGRTSHEQITLYKSVGVAVQDGAAASLVLSAARERGIGVEVEIAQP
jgi:alanine dehydrogenase